MSIKYLIHTRFGDVECEQGKEISHDPWDDQQMVVFGTTIDENPRNIYTIVISPEYGARTLDSTFPLFYFPPEVKELDPDLAIFRDYPTLGKLLRRIIRERN